MILTPAATMSMMAAEEQQLPKGLGTPGASRLRHELQRCGVRLPVQVTGIGPAGTGASKLVDAAAIANSPAAADQVCEQVFDILVRGEALSVSLGRVAVDGDGSTAVLVDPSTGQTFARVRLANPLVGGEFTVLARQVPERLEVPAEVVRETARVMEAEFCRRGILFVTGSFTAEARTLARSLSVELVDRTRWVRMYGG